VVLDVRWNEHTCRDQRMYVALVSFPAFKSKPYNKGSGHFFDSERLLPPSTHFSFLPWSFLTLLRFFPFFGA